MVFFLQPLPVEHNTKLDFLDESNGTHVPKNFVPAILKEFIRVCDVGGPLTGSKISGCRLRLQDGDNHCVDSSDLAFQLATLGAMKDRTFKFCFFARHFRPIMIFFLVFQDAPWQLLEPIMNVEIVAPVEHQGGVMGMVSKRSGLIISHEGTAHWFTLVAEVSVTFHEQIIKACH